jgi:hypothetical protein
VYSPGSVVPGGGVVYFKVILIPEIAPVSKILRDCKLQKKGRLKDTKRCKYEKDKQTYSIEYK